MPTLLHMPVSQTLANLSREKENADIDLTAGLKSMFQKQKSRRRSAVGLKPLPEAKRAALPDDDPSRPAAGSPERAQAYTAVYSDVRPLTIQQHHYQELAPAAAAASPPPPPPPPEAKGTTPRQAAPLKSPAHKSTPPIPPPAPAPAPPSSSPPASASPASEEIVVGLSGLNVGGMPPSSAAWLLRRAVHSVDAEAPGSNWKPLRRALLELADLQASWGSDEAAFAPPPIPGGRPRLVRFNPADGSHLEPPAWGRDPPLATGAAHARLNEAVRLFTAMSSQLVWLKKMGVAPGLAAAAPRRPGLGGVTGTGLTGTPVTAGGRSQPTTAMPEEARELVASVRAALSSARAEAEAVLFSSTMSKSVTGASTSPSAALERSRHAERERMRARSAAAFLDAELARLAAGQPMLRPLLSSLLSSCLRQQLRRIFEGDYQRAAELLRGLPRGRGIGFLAKADSAAKVISCALYEARQLSPMLQDPSLRALLHKSDRDA